MTFWEIRVKGIVQGVGFRPFINNLAKEHTIKGWVLNDKKGVLIHVQAQSNSFERFYNEITSRCPVAAKIISIEKSVLKHVETLYKDFHIQSSNSEGQNTALISPDLSVCNDCLDDIYNPQNRRHRYAFTNCTNCGPRYSIIKAMPYDRKNTTMKHFRMCSKCENEYNNEKDRRFHAQPNACPECGPEVQILDSLENVVNSADPLNFAREQLKKGKILAVKSLGGFHLAVDANNEEAVKRLRVRKKRPKKPFALMVKDEVSLLKYCIPSTKERQVIDSIERPIVIIEQALGSNLPKCIAPSNINLGVMYPSTPLHYLLFDAELEILVMTSGNTSGKPMAFTNEAALNDLKNIADFFVLHNRDIRMRVDDSIVQTIQDGVSEEVVFLRRARGFAPFPIQSDFELGDFLALGPELKSTIALSKKNNAFLSQYIGDLSNSETIRSHKDMCVYMSKLLEIEYDTIICDQHPNFHTTKFALEHETENIIQVQHHHAHMASCMIENNLKSDVIAVLLDGTGYGEDGGLWGAEMFIGNYQSFERVASIKPLRLIGGDSAVKEPYRVAISLLINAFDEADVSGFESINKCVDEFALNILQKMNAKGVNTFNSTSMGRLFDGVSSLIGVCSKISYEAQAAIELENLLKNNYSMVDGYSFKFLKNIDGIYEFDYIPMIRELVNDIKIKQYSKEMLSRKFHSTVVNYIVSSIGILKTESGIDNIVLSGGVFMNRFILSNVINELRVIGVCPYYHKNVPTNDGGVSLGQIAVASAKIKKIAPLKKEKVLG